MIRGLYCAASGMDAQQAKVENVSNNLANATTSGFKKESIQLQSFPEILLTEQGGPSRTVGTMALDAPQKIGTVGMGALVAGVSTDHSPGALQETGNSTDIALKGPGFFAVNVPSAEDPERVCYTRSGSFNLDQEGYLAVSSGYRLLGEGGAIQVGDTGFKLAPDGTIEAGGVTVDKLRIVEFDDLKGLRKESDGIFIDVQEAARPASSTVVGQGYLERSNVNVIDEMVDLISVMRSYEANQRLIQSHDEMLAKAVSQVGSLR